MFTHYFLFLQEEDYEEEEEQDDDNEDEEELEEDSLLNSDESFSVDIVRGNTDLISQRATNPRPTS
jgi:hypothetical protein